MVKSVFFLLFLVERLSSAQGEDIESIYDESRPSQTSTTSGRVRFSETTRELLKDAFKEYITGSKKINTFNAKEVLYFNNKVRSHVIRDTQGIPYSKKMKTVCDAVRAYRRTLRS